MTFGDRLFAAVFAERMRGCVLEEIFDLSATLDGRLRFTIITIARLSKRSHGEAREGLSSGTLRNLRRTEIQRSTEM